MASHPFHSPPGPDGFADREEAGRRLASALATYRKADVLVLGIPRGGVPVAAEVARALDAELDVVVARKLGAPGHSELAIGAVTANGGQFLDHEIMTDLGVSDAYLEKIIDAEAGIARRREKQFRWDQPAPRVEGRTVIIVDDGLATGATMRAALRTVRKHGPTRLVVAVPVGSAEACEALRAETDDVICLLVPSAFYAVGMYYRNFLPTEDADVEGILAESRRRRTIGAHASNAS